MKFSGLGNERLGPEGEEAVAKSSRYCVWSCIEGVCVQLPAVCALSVVRDGAVGGVGVGRGREWWQSAKLGEVGLQ